MRYRVAMDIGGTFTDVVVHDTETGSVRAGKTSTTPGNLTDGLINAIRYMEIDPKEVGTFVHGTTQGLNALLERRGATTWLITNDGMGDVYFIARGNRDRMFDLHYRKPKPLIDRSSVFEVRGRIKSDGTELVSLDEARIHEIAILAKDAGVEAIAVSYLFSFRNADHERRTAAILKEHLGSSVLVAMSHDVASEWREYERTSSTVLEAYTGPVVRRYLDRIRERFDSVAVPAPVQVMQSSGGIIDDSYAREHPLQTLLSGPVGGTAGGVFLAELLKHKDLICVDMGGTSFDVSLILDGHPDISTDGVVDGHPVIMPLVNLHTIGAGGGSIARVEASGLRVGPQSAGADPGPACYGRGGTLATVSDANCALGRIDPENFAGGQMILDSNAARSALRPIAEELRLEVNELAEGIIQVANVSMAQAIRRLTVEHGREPNEFALVAFGGAGPMHAEGIARELGVQRVIIPSSPGAFSAWGMLGADVRRDFTRQCFVHQFEFDAHEMRRLIADLRLEAEEALERQAVEPDRWQFLVYFDMRYAGQDFTLRVPLESEDEVLSEDFLTTIARRFGEAHLQRFGHATESTPVEFVRLRLTGNGINPFGHITGSATVEDYEKEPRTLHVIFGGEAYTTPVRNRATLPIGVPIAGPLVIVEETTTTVLSPSSTVVRDNSGLLTLEVDSLA